MEKNQRAFIGGDQVVSTPPTPLSQRGRSLLTQLHSRYGYACYSSCSKGEESYYWCYTSWHIHKVMNRQSTSNRNWPLLLNTVCLKMWEYCAPPNKTIYGARCASECAKRGKDYWWEISLLRLYRFCSKKIIEDRQTRYFWAMKLIRCPLCKISKHLKGHLDPPVSDVTFLGQTRSVGPPVSDVTFLDQRRSVGPPC